LLPLLLLPELPEEPEFLLLPLLPLSAPVLLRLLLLFEPLEPVAREPFEPPVPWSVVLDVVPLVAWAAATVRMPVADPAARTRPAVAIRARVMSLCRCAVMTRWLPGPLQPTPKRGSNRGQIDL
jgi:hypothetical protein